ncbi:MAG TPA: 2-C-methyl-D-erythritol 2,4-cyclodiphosphate synthase [Acidimicrobiales bacterium]|nr:2-C-methyl-D-erythritol 2,4-cyclodiphosphate synthase [Acidimicrobiales bacterium]
MIRVGQGTDAHRFSDDVSRPLVLCGVAVPGSPGLAGHSDADVATHALCDAILGAAGLGDLGRHFPDTDPAYEGASSLSLLARCCAMARAAGLTVGNADVTVLAAAPRLAPLLEAMAATLAGVVAAPVSVKATTTDGLGAVGRGEGIAASAVVLLVDASAP